jgi:hypothetical protein
MKIEELIVKSEELIQWLDQRIDGIEISSEERIRLVAGCLDTALEHHKAVLLLVARSLFGSAFALVRLLFEAYIKGIWLHRCASDSDIQLFKAEKLDKNFGAFIEDIEKIEGFEEGILSDTKTKSWKAMNSYTHSGFMQVVRRNTASTIEPNYTEDEILEALNFANAIGLLSALEISYLSGSKQLASSILKKAEGLQSSKS